MLTDDELTQRLGAAFHESVPEMEYAGRVPRVKHRGGLAAMSVLAGSATLALAPTILQRPDERASDAAPNARTGNHQTSSPGRAVTRTIDIAGIRLTYAAVAGRSGPLFFVVGPPGAVSLPPDAQKVVIDYPVDVWAGTDAVRGGAALYWHDPDDSSILFEVFSPTWTQQQLIDWLSNGADASAR